MAYDRCQEHPVRSVVISDHSAVSACNRFIEDHRTVVEPACGAALAVAYEGNEALNDLESILVIVCGGATVTVDQLRDWEGTLPKLDDPG